MRKQYTVDVTEDVSGRRNGKLIAPTPSSTALPTHMSTPTPSKCSPKLKPKPKPKYQCSICLEDYDRSWKVFGFGCCSSQVCRECRTQIEKCPGCRAPIPTGCVRDTQQPPAQGTPRAAPRPRPPAPPVPVGSLCRYMDCTQPQRGGWRGFCRTHDVICVRRMVRVGNHTPVLACGAAGKRVRMDPRHVLLDYRIKDGVGTNTYPLEQIQAVIAERSGVSYGNVRPTEPLRYGSLVYHFTLL